MYHLTKTEKKVITSGRDYVYGYYHPVSGLPFYIGKGKNRRCLDHLKQAKEGKIDSGNHIKSGILQSLLNKGSYPKIKIIIVGSSDYCYEMESKLIELYGRVYDGSGILSNIAQGGQYGPGSAVIKERLNSKYKDNLHDEMLRRSKMGNSEESVKKKNETRILIHGDLKTAYKKEQQKRLKTMQERGGWSIKCYDIDEKVIKVVKKNEFDSSLNLVGMTSKKIPVELRKKAGNRWKEYKKKVIEHETNKVPVEGVYISQYHGKWISVIGGNKKTIYLGSFDNLSEAVFARLAGEQCLDREDINSDAYKYCMNELGI